MAWIVSSTAGATLKNERYEAFPDATRTSSGRVIATWSTGDNHSDRELQGNLGFSYDGGVTWTSRAHPTAAAITSRGTQVAMLHISWEGGTRTAWLYRSNDEGETWLPRQQITAWGNTGAIYPSDIAWHSDGSPNGLLMATSYGTDGVIVVASTDGGLTWGRRSVAKKGKVWQDATETTTLMLPGGEIIMLLRNDSTVNIELLRSQDGGYTWSKPVVVMRRMSGLPRLSRMYDGSLLVTLRDRSVGAARDGRWAMGRSVDGGSTWSTMLPLGDEWMMYGRFVPTEDGKAALVGASQLRGSSTRSRVWARQVTGPEPGTFDPNDPPAAIPDWEVDPAPVSAGQDLAMRLVAYDVEEPVGILTGILSASVYTPFNDDSVLQLTYDLEHDGLASRVFQNEWDIAVQFNYGDGTWHEPPGCRFIPVEESGDNSELGAHMEMTAVGVAFDLSSAVTLDGSLLDDQGRRRFHNATPGAYLTSYVASAQSKGVCTALGLDFSSAVDSATATWTHGVSMDIQGNVSAREVLQSLTDQAMCDWRMQGNTLQMYRAIPSVTSAELVLGREVSSRHEGRTGRELADIVAVIADEGLFRVTHSGRSPRKRGFRARALSQGGVSQEATLALLASSALEQGASTREQVTRDLRFGVGVQHLPFRDYLPGQFVRTTGLNTESASLEEVRVHAITIEMDQEGFLKGAVTLNDRLLDRSVRQSRRIEGIVGGSTLAGGTNAQPLPPPTEQATPEAPTGLSYSASVHTLQAGEMPQGVLTLAWSPIQWDTKGKEIAVSEYEILILLGDEVIQVAKAMSNTATLRGLPTQSTVTVRVRGISHEGKPGAWSTITADIGLDAEPPPTPSTPLLESNFGLLRVAWDGLSDTGGSMPADFSHLDVYIGGEPNPVGRIDGRHGFVTLNRGHGEYVQAFFVAVDTTGNHSPESVRSGITIRSLRDDPNYIEDVVAGEIHAEDIIAGEISGWVIEGSEFRSRDPLNPNSTISISGGSVRTQLTYDDPWAPGHQVVRSTHLLSGSVTMEIDNAGADSFSYGQVNASGMFLSSRGAKSGPEYPRTEAQISPGRLSVSTLTGETESQLLGPSTSIQPGGLYGFDNHADGSRTVLDLSQMLGLQLQKHRPGLAPVFTHYEWDQIWASQSFQIVSNQTLALEANSIRVGSAGGSRFNIFQSGQVTFYGPGTNQYMNFRTDGGMEFRAADAGGRAMVSGGTYEGVELGQSGVGRHITAGITGSAGRLAISPHPTSTSAANMFMSSSNGIIYRSTSLRADKVNLGDLPFDVDSYLALRPRDWVDREAAERYADFLSAEAEGEEPEPWLTDMSVGLRRIPGLVAEEVVESGNEWLAQYDAEGGLTGVAYDRGWVPLIPIVRELRERIMQLEAQHA